MPKGKKVVDDSIVIDALFHGLFEDPPIEADDEKTVIDMLLDGGVTAISDTVMDDNYPSSFTDCCKKLHYYYLLEDTLPEQVIIVKNAEDIETAKKTGKLGVILSTQGADVFERDLRYITILEKLHVKIVQLTYNQQGLLGSGVYEPVDHGLTRFGEQCIYEMNRVGILIDLSHVGHNTALDAINTSEQPVIFSHSSAQAICSHKRNCPDHLIRALVPKGGVICVCPHSVMTDDDQSKWPTVDRFIDHIVHIANIAGIDHIGIGTDRWKRSTLYAKMGRIRFDRTLPGWFGAFNDEEKQVKGFNYFDKWDNFASHMLARGFTDEEVKKVLGGNLMRVFKQVW